MKKLFLNNIKRLGGIFGPQGCCPYCGYCGPMPWGRCENCGSEIDTN